LMLHPAAGGGLETLGSPSMGLHFRHGSSSSLVMLPVSWYFWLGQPAGAWSGEKSSEVLLPFLSLFAFLAFWLFGFLVFWFFFFQGLSCGHFGPVNKAPDAVPGRDLHLTPCNLIYLSDILDFHQLTISPRQKNFL